MKRMLDNIFFFAAILFLPMSFVNVRSWAGDVAPSETVSQKTLESFVQTLQIVQAASADGRSCHTECFYVPCCYAGPSPICNTVCDDDR